ncbi:PEPxxWA-CTERM sorting domain-containing protein [Pseudokordiimonas caeni]|uniref:PEPxxWA-CTERM sorting domain-containing protein n=1 Tax=Pseudokordiimonas caeni TaxID=2997908 RepID=UPI0028126B62|nr:PEPxxWA-CTERM sorting domain-containing protein [Pseudokordiimonas caeni]
MIRLLSGVRAAFAAVVLIGALSTGANAAVYEFTGDALISADKAAYFGFSSMGTYSFHAKLTIDDPHPTSSFLIDSEYLHDELSFYEYSIFQWTLGNKSWEFYGGNTYDQNQIVVIDGIEDRIYGTLDGLNVEGYEEVALPGITITGSALYAQNDNEHIFSGSDIAQLDNWNDIETTLVAPGLRAGGAIGIDLQPGYIGLYNVVMTRVDGSVSGIPEPATWLMMIMGFGLAGVAARRRRWLAA